MLALGAAAVAYHLKKEERGKMKEDVPVADITMACGFSDPSSFRRSFAGKFGVNLSQYRSML